MGPRLEKIEKGAETNGNRNRNYSGYFTAEYKGINRIWNGMLADNNLNPQDYMLGSVGYIVYFLTNNNRFPMRDWHVKHMEQTIIKYIEGLPEGASRYQQKLHKKYGGIGKMCNMIEYDMKHGVTNEELLLFLRKIRTEPSYSELRKNDACLERLHEIELRFR